MMRGERKILGIDTAIQSLLWAKNGLRAMDYL